MSKSVFPVEYFYKLDKEIGRGGMGVVYRARKVSKLEGHKLPTRKVAIKVPFQSFIFC